VRAWLSNHAVTSVQAFFSIIRVPLTLPLSLSLPFALQTYHFFEIPLTPTWLLSFLSAIRCSGWNLHLVASPAHCMCVIYHHRNPPSMNSNSQTCRLPD
jgi:hypothetical protein